MVVAVLLMGLGSLKSAHSVKDNHISKMRSRFLSKSYEQDLISSKVQILHEMPTGKLGPSIDINNFPGRASTTEEFSTGGIEEGSMQVGHPEQDFVFSTSKMIHDRFMQETIDYEIKQLGSDLYGDDDDRFGHSVALANLANGGYRVAISAYWFEEQRGKVRIYDYMNNGWQVVGEMTGDASGDHFGHSVALSNDGNRVAIGATHHNNYHGRVKIFEYNSNNVWEQVGSDIDGESHDNRSGQSVSLSNDGNRVAIGAPYNSGSAYASGHVRIYEYTSNNSWEQLGSDIDGYAQEDLSGWSVSLSKDGKRVAIGAYQNDNNDKNGFVRVLEYGSNTWTKLGDDLIGVGDRDRFGWSVSLSYNGNRVAIGGTYQDGINGRSDSLHDYGHVRVYEYDNGNGWQMLGSDIYGQNTDDESGYSVSLSNEGDRVVIGAIRGDDNNKNVANTGHVRIYDYINNVWQLVGEISGDRVGDTFGYSVALSNDAKHVAIGAPNNDGIDGSIHSRGQVKVLEIISAATPAPTLSPTAPPTVSIFSWNMTDPRENWNVAFDDNSGNSEITGTYEMTPTRSYQFQVFKQDCEASIEDGAITIPTGSVGSVPESGNVDLSIDIDPSMLELTSGVLFPDPSKAYHKNIKICVRADLKTTVNGPSVNFLETILNIVVDMSTDFSVDDILTERTNATETSQNATLDYTDQAYLCDDAEVGNISTWTSSTNAPKKQNDLIQVCYEITNGETAKVNPERVLEWSIKSSGQDGTDESTLTDTSNDLDLVSLTECKENKCFIKSVILAHHFAADRFDGTKKPTLAVNGKILLKFGNGNRRLVQANDVVLRALQDSTEGQFNVNVGLEGDSLLEPQNENDSSARSFSSSGAIKLVALLIAGSFFALI